MATTYMQLARQIKELEAQAEQVKRKEVVGVISQIKEAIAAYALTAEDLGLAGSTGARLRSEKGALGLQAGDKRKASRKSATTAYQDGAGNTWGGRGPRPAWLRAALAGGSSLESFSVGSVQRPATPLLAEPYAARPPAELESAQVRLVVKSLAKQKKRALSASYKDDAGNTWSGLGPKPRWFKEALAAGKTPQELKS